MCVTNTRKTDAAQSTTASAMMPARLALSRESGRFFTMYSAKLSISVKTPFMGTFRQNVALSVPVAF